jgi:hypothetical protein
MDDEWSLSSADLSNGEWFTWDHGVAADRLDLAQAIRDFDAHRKNPDAADKATEWLRNEAVGEEACVTRLLVANDHVAAFYALASGEIKLTSGKRLEAMGIQGGARVGSSHVEWIARDRRAPGAGKLAIHHAIATAVRVSRLQGNRALTLDPYDLGTAEMWKQLGFRNSQTELSDGLQRLFVPLFGRRYGRRL